MKKLLLMLSTFLTLLVFSNAAFGQRTICIDFVNGSDSNTGTTNGTCHDPGYNNAFKRHPYMAGFSGSYMHNNGDRFIFKCNTRWDGTTWPIDIVAGGTATQPDFYTYDPQWGSCTTALPELSGCLPGATFSKCVTADPSAWDHTQIAPLALLFDYGYAGHIHVNGLIIKDEYCSITNQVAGGCAAAYMREGKTDIQFDSVLIKTWYAQQVTSGTALVAGDCRTTAHQITCDDKFGGIIHNAYGALGCCDNTGISNSEIENSKGGLLNVAGTQIDTNVLNQPQPIDGHAGFGYPIRSLNYFKNNYFHDTVNVDIFGGETIAYNYFVNINYCCGSGGNHNWAQVVGQPPGPDWIGGSNSQNLIESEQWQGDSNQTTRPEYIHHNVFLHTQPNAPTIYSGIQNTSSLHVPQQTMYWYNNISIDSEWGFASQFILDDPPEGPADKYNVVATNNLTDVRDDSLGTCVQMQASKPLGNNSIATGTIRNHQCIYSALVGAGGDFYFADTVVKTKYLEWCHTTLQCANSAQSNGYLAVNYYAPPNQNGATVGAGDTLTCSNCPDYNKAFAIPLNVSTFPTTKTWNLVTRTAAWDIGPYQFARLLAGDANIETFVDFAPAGTAQADQVTASGTGSVTSISVYIDSSNQATNWIVGLYSDSSGHPGTLLTSGSTTQFTNGTWNTIPVTAVNVTSGTAYWIAVLSPQGGGESRFRDNLNGGCSSESSQSQSLTTLPSTWTTGTIYNTNCPLSAYASGQ